MLVEMIKNHALFKDIDADLTPLVEYAKDIIFQKNDFIFHEGEDANSFYLITYGKISLELSTAHRGRIIIQTLGKDEVLGISWLFPPYKWHFDARALELSRVVKLDANLVMRRCEEDNRLGYYLMKRFAGVIMKRLQAVRFQLIEMEEM
ncbi:MAG: cyclic nucleotide-binding domain-containing protein [Candidatus Nitrosothermus koennekii]|nr:MAG: cyclic nucleotide-binding domain-containing protein [Candidatus Nitrosothermus koennekii]